MPGPDAKQLAALWTKAQPAIAGYVTSVVRKHESCDIDGPFSPWVIGIVQPTTITTGNWLTTICHAAGVPQDHLGQSDYALGKREM